MEAPANQWLALAGFIGVCFLVAAFSGIATTKAIPTWYAGIAKPGFTPPNQVFAPVWTILYALMGIAAWLVWRMPTASQLRLELDLLQAAPHSRRRARDPRPLGGNPLHARRLQQR